MSALPTAIFPMASMYSAACEVNADTINHLIKFRMMNLLGLYDSMSDASIHTDRGRLDLCRDERAVNQVFHIYRLFQYPGFQSHIVNLLQIFVGRREHPVADAVWRLGQHVAH